MAVISRETQEEHLRNGQSRDTSVSRINADNVTQVSEEIEGGVTKNFSQEFSRTEFCILSALSQIDESLLNPQIRTLSGTVPAISRNMDVENQEPTGDQSQSNPHPEVGSSVYQSHNTNDSDLKEAYYSNGVY